MFNKIKEKILFWIAPELFVLEKYVGMIPLGIKDSEVFVSDDPGHEDSILIYNPDTKEAVWYNIITKMHR